MASAYYGYWEYGQKLQQLPQQPQQNKAKKSLAERIGKTFDRIALPKESKSPKQPQPQPLVYLPHVYQAYPPVPGSNQSRLAATTSLLHSWDKYQKPGQPFTIKRPHHQPHPVAIRQATGATPTSSRSSSPSLKPQAFCQCQDYFFGSVRGGYPVKSGRCKRCHKVKSGFVNTHNHHQPHTKLIRTSNKDPYEYLRHTRIYANPNELDHGWQSYWIEDDADDEANEQKGQSNRLDHNKEGEEDRAIKNGDADHIKWAEETGSASVNKKKSILDPGLDPYKLNQGDEEDEEELGKEQVLVDKSDKDDKDDFKSVKQGDDKSEGPDAHQGEEDRDQNTELSEITDDCDVEPSLKTSLLTSPQRSIKSTKLKRVLASKRLQIAEDIIPEETEAELEAERLRVICSPLETPVRSILKQEGSVSTSLKKEVTFNDANMGSTESKVDQGAVDKTVTESEKASKESDDDDEWSGYDKVVVSHNLAEEILNEIYGKICRDEQRLADNKEEEELTEKERLKRSMAEEILDEIYGDTDAEKNGEKSPPKSSSPKLGNRCQDDSSLPDSKQVIDWSHRFSVDMGSLKSDQKRHVMSVMLNDTTRLKLQTRSSLANLFPHESPSLSEGQKGKLPPGAKPDFPPPLPPPNNASKPSLPPKPDPSMMGFSKIEEDRINNFINNHSSGGSASDSSDDSWDDEDVFSSSDEFDSSYQAKHRLQMPENVYDIAEHVEQPEEVSGDGKNQNQDNSNAKSDEDASSGISSCCSSSNNSTSQPAKDPLISSFKDKTVIRTSENIKLKQEMVASVIESAIMKNKIVDDSEVNSSSSTNDNVTISSSSWINVQNFEENVDNKSGASDVKPPPRLKKLAKQARQERLHRASSEGDIGQQRKLEISAPILVASTLNPSDVESHKVIEARPDAKASELPRRSSSPTLMIPSKSSSSLSQVSDFVDKLSFKELKRLSSLLPSLSSYKHSSLSVFSSSKSSENLSQRSSFYVAEAIYEEEMMSKEATDAEHIYEEILDHVNANSSTLASIVRPLPPIPEDGSDQTSSGVKSSSIFEGASKYEILQYLRNAKDRIGHADFEIDLESDFRDEGFDNSFIGQRNHSSRVSGISTASDSSSGSSNDSVLLRSQTFDRIRVEVERNDSGVGSETGSTGDTMGSRYRHGNQRSLSHETLMTVDETRFSVSADSQRSKNNRCVDCFLWMELDLTRPNHVSVCIKCAKRRSERKDIITELYETELKYGRDLRIIMEEFHRPMLVAGLLTSDQLAGIFLNTEELIQVNASFVDVLRTAIEDAVSRGDNDLSDVQVGKLFIESLFMLRAYESYCTRQGSASVLLANLEKDKELLKIFLKVSQMENSTLRRMNLSSFLMVPVQRVTKYPLLLSRLYKVTPVNTKDREAIKHAKERIEAALEQMNKDAKDVNGSRQIWKRLPIMSAATSSPTKNKSELTEEEELQVTKKMAIETLSWKPEESQIPLAGRLQFNQPSDANWKRPFTGKMSQISACLVVWSNQELPHVTGGKELIFPNESVCIKDAQLVMFKVNSKPSLSRDPLPLERCIICCEPEWEDIFEIQDFVNKEYFIFKGNDPEHTKMWFQTLQFYTQSLGGWRKRRKGLGNIMVDPKVVEGAEANPGDQVDDNNDKK